MTEIRGWLSSTTVARTKRFPLCLKDSAVFQVVGKYWLEGVIPYKDLFDHKGALVYVANALGYAIYPRAGVMVPQIICLYLSSLFVWRAMELYWRGNVVKIFFLALTLIYYAAHYEEGNHVTEYSVPFLSVAAYCFLRSLKENVFPPLYGFIYGLGFGACFLIRLSDAAQICCQVFLVAIFLLQARAFKNLWRNVLSFGAGVVSIVLPFVIYFAAHDALYDMLYGTLLLNINYTVDETIHLEPFDRTIHAAVHYLPFLAMMLVATLALLQNPKSRLLQSGLFIEAAVVFMLINLRPSDQYAMIFFAVAPILFAVIYESNDALQNIWRNPKFSFKRLLIKLLIGLMVIHFYILTSHLKGIILNEQSEMASFFSTYKKHEELFNSSERQNILKLRSLIPESERASFACWGNFCTGSHWILQADMKPRERFFMNNSLLTKMDPRIRQEYFGNLRRDYPLWIVYGVDPNRKPGEPPRTSVEDAELEQLLKEKYSLKGETFIYPQIMKLYRLKG